MAKSKTVKGIKFAAGVDTSFMDLEDDPKAVAELLAELKKPAKIRITAMVDADLLAELKKRATKDKRYGGKYQTYLNDLLRSALFKEAAPLESLVSELLKRVEALEGKSGKKPRRSA